MGDAIKPASGPGSSDDVGSRPDVGFHDDHVGGHLKAEEAAKRRAAIGVSQRRPKRIELEPRQIGEVRQSRGAPDDGTRELDRQQRGLVQGRGPARQKTQGRRPGGVPYAVDQDVRRIEERVDVLMETLAELDAAAGHPPPEPHEAERSDGTQLPAEARHHEGALQQAKRGRAQLAGQPSASEVDKLREARVVRQRREHDREQGGDGAFDEAGHEDDAPEGEGTDAREARWQRAARDMRFLLQHLIAGGIGLTLAADPEQTFRRLFEGLPAWPPRVPPGRRPSSEADYDAFLAWIFTPDELAAALLEAEPSAAR